MRHPPSSAVSAIPVLLLVLALAGGLRLYKLGEQDYWLDEMHTMTDSAGVRAAFEALPHGVILSTVPRFMDLPSEATWSTVWRGMAADSHPPLFFMFFQTWRGAFGDGEFTARLPAALFSVASILVVALIARAHGRLRDGVWIALVLAVTYSHVFMAQQARPYTLALLLVSLSYWSLVTMELGWADFTHRRKLLWALVYAGTTYLSVLTHYFAGFALLGQMVVVLNHRAQSSNGAGAAAPRGLKPAARGRWRIAQGDPGGKRRTFRRAWAVTVAIVLVVFVLTWGRQVLAQWDFIESHIWLLEEHPDHIRRTLLRLTDLPVRLMFAHEEFRFNYAYSLIGLCLIAAVVLALWRRRCRLAVVFAAWYFAPVVAFALIDLISERQTLSHLRYVSVATPGLVGMLVLAALHLRRSLRWVCVASFAALVLLTLRLPTQDNPHNRLAASLIAERATPETLLVFDAIDWQPFWVSQVFHNVAYYLPQFMEDPLPPCVLLRDRPSPALRAQMAEYKRITVVSPRVDEIPNPFPGSYLLVERTPYVEQIGWVYLFLEPAARP